MSNGVKFEYNWPFFGNQHIVDYLQMSIHNRKLAHFYIFAGLQDLGKATLATYFASSLLCHNFADGRGKLPCDECPSCHQIKVGIHSDVQMLKRKEGKKNIAIDQIRDFIRMMNLGSFAGSYKIGIIKEGETLSIEAANALLKTLEEPKVRVIIILLTSFLDKLPATITSRGQVLLFRPVAARYVYDYLVKHYGALRDNARAISKLSIGRPALAVKLWQDKDFLKEKKYLITSLITIMQADINERWRLVNELFACQPTTAINKGQEGVETAHTILQAWQTIVRDLILLNFNLDDLITHELFVSELKEVKVSFEELLYLHAKTEQGKEYLAANVNPRLVLEEISLTI